VRGVRGIRVLSESEVRASAELVCGDDVVARVLGLCCRVTAGVCEVFDIAGFNVCLVWGWTDKDLLSEVHPAGLSWRRASKTKRVSWGEWDTRRSGQASDQQDPSTLDAAIGLVISRAGRRVVQRQETGM